MQQTVLPILSLNLPCGSERVLNRWSCPWCHLCLQDWSRFLIAKLGRWLVEKRAAMNSTTYTLQIKPRFVRNKFKTPSYTFGVRKREKVIEFAMCDFTLGCCIGNSVIHEYQKKLEEIDPIFELPPLPLSCHTTLALDKQIQQRQQFLTHSLCILTGGQATCLKSLSWLDASNIWVITKMPPGAGPRV